MKKKRRTRDLVDDQRNSGDGNGEKNYKKKTFRKRTIVIEKQFTTESQKFCLKNEFF